MDLFRSAPERLQQPAQEREQTRVRHVAHSRQRRQTQPAPPKLLVGISSEQAQNARRAAGRRRVDPHVGCQHPPQPGVSKTALAVPQPVCDCRRVRHDLRTKTGRPERSPSVMVGSSRQRKAFLVSLRPVHGLLNSTGEGSTSTGVCGRGARVASQTTSCRMRFTATLAGVESHNPGLGVAACAVVLSLLPVQRALAQASACGVRSRSASEIEVTPSDRAENVARNAPIIVRYQPGADLDALTRSLQLQTDEVCGSALVCLLHDARASGGSAREPVQGTVQRIDSLTVSFVADKLLARNSTYYSAIARPGFDGAVRRELRFDTGRDEDMEAPMFTSSNQAIALSIDVPPDECDAAQDSLRVTLSVPRAQDDGDEGSVEVLLFLSRAAGLAGPMLVDRARNPKADAEESDVRMGFLLTAAQAKERVCIELRAVDGVGKVSKGKPGLCFDPAGGSSFAPLCATPFPRGAKRDDLGGRTLVAFWAIAAALLVRRRARRSTSAMFADTRAK